MSVADIPETIGHVFHVIKDLFFNIITITIKIWFIYTPFWIRWIFLGILLLISMGFIIWAIRNRNGWEKVYCN